MYFYYACHNRIHRKCDQEILPAHKVDEFLSKEILGYILDENTLRELTKRLEEAIRKETDAFGKREADLRREKEKIEKQIDNLVKAITLGIDPEAVRDELNRLQRLREKIEAELLRAKRLKTLSVTPQIKPEQVRSMFEELLASGDYYKIRTFFRTLVKEITYNNRTFEVQYSPELFAIEGSQGTLYDLAANLLKVRIVA